METPQVEEQGQGFGQGYDIPTMEPHYRVHRGTGLVVQRSWGQVGPELTCVMNVTYC